MGINTAYKQLKQKLTTCILNENFREIHLFVFLESVRLKDRILISSLC